MSKKLYLLFIFLSIISLIHSDEDINDYYELEDLIYDKEDDENYFKEIVKNYLIENKLWDDNKLIQPDELKKIFLDITSDGEDINDNKIKNIFDKVADYFIKRYYKVKKEITGKDIYKMMKVSQITFKFEEFLKERKGDEDEEELDEDDDDDDYNDYYDRYDNMNDFGEPNDDL